MISTFGGYSLALKRNMAGHVGAAAAASLVAGDEERGGFGDKKVVISFEHKAAAAKRCRSAQCHAAFADSLVAVELVHDSIAPVPVSALEVHCFKGDATNQDAIGKEKVHTSLVSSSLLATFPDLDVYSFDQTRLETDRSGMNFIINLNITQITLSVINAGIP